MTRRRRLDSDEPIAGPQPLPDVTEERPVPGKADNPVGDALPGLLTADAHTTDLPTLRQAVAVPIGRLDRLQYTELISRLVDVLLDVAAAIAEHQEDR